MSEINDFARPSVDKPILSLRGFTKEFSGVLAIDSIDLDIYQGEVHALLGENGAGKSTLVKCLYGFYQRDSGAISIHDRSVDIRSPHDAREHQIGMVFQNLTLIPALSVVENIALFLPELPAVPDLKSIAQEITELGTRYHLEVDPWATVRDLSIGQQQKAELLKLLLAKSRILILDEPTRVLAPHEIKGFFEVLERLVNDNFAVILIAHKLNEVLQCADRITVLRRGRVEGNLSRPEATEEKLVKMMFEKEISVPNLDRKEKQTEKDLPILSLHDVSTRGEGAVTSLKNIDLNIYPGEIVGIAGVSGNGQRELGDVILGGIKCVSGAKHLHGEDVTNHSIRQLRRAGINFIPENPLTMATIPYMTVLENMAVTNLKHYSLYGGMKINWQAVKNDTEDAMRRLGFSFPLYNPAKSLSGGNLQRVVIAREMSHKPQLIIALYLTRGLDVQSTNAARQALLQARDNGAGVLLISEDLEELFNLSNRLIIIHGGSIVGEFEPKETNSYQVGLMMTGSGFESVN